MTRLSLALFVSLATVPTLGLAQHSGHAPQLDAATEAGQAAFVALSEIVAILQADPTTDWTRVDIEALRQHLIDMDRVTMASAITRTGIPDGARFTVTGETADVIASIQRMTQAHVATIDGRSDWVMTAEPTANGATMEVTGPTERETEMIRGLGFAGILTMGMHHPVHHLAIARGTSPHGH